MTDFDTCLLLNSSFFGSRPTHPYTYMYQFLEIEILYRKMIKPIRGTGVDRSLSRSLLCEFSPFNADVVRVWPSRLLGFSLGRRLFRPVGPAVVLRAKFNIKGHFGIEEDAVISDI